MFGHLHLEAIEIIQKKFRQPWLQYPGMSMARIEDLPIGKFDIVVGTLGSASAVASLYPSGASVESACDMVGIVFEWTASKWSQGTGNHVWRGVAFG